VWVAIWKVWLPAPGPGSPSRRSTTVSLALLVLGVASAVVGLFHERLNSIKISTSGIEIEMTKAQRAGALELVSALGTRNAPRNAYVKGLRLYISKLPPAESPLKGLTEEADEPYKELAQRIAAGLAPG